MEIVARPLTAEAFAPFGEVIRLGDEARRVRAQGAFERRPEAAEPRLWVATLLRAVTLPLAPRICAMRLAGS